MLGPGWNLRHADAEDMLNEAVTRTLEPERRRWKRGISIHDHLLGCMRSIANEFFQKANRQPASELLDSHPADPYRPDAALDARRHIHDLLHHLEGDVVALDVLQTLRDELLPPDAQDKLGITADVYWAARKRILRRLRALVFPARHKP
jgi:DNA-directed RNA polymerase specialized sigma24 family protein